MGFAEIMEKKMNEILISAEEMLKELDKEIEVLQKQIDDLKSRRSGIIELKQSALKALGLSETENPASEETKKELEEEEEEENLLEEDNPEEDLDTSFLD